MTTPEQTPDPPDPAEQERKEIPDMAERLTGKSSGGFDAEIRAMVGNILASGVVGGGSFVNSTVIALGDIVGRDKAVSPTVTAGRPLPQLVPRTVRELYQVHVGRGCEQALIERIRKCPLVVLTGPHGCGKAALAINLLTDACTEIYELSKLPDLSSVPGGFFQEGAGYLLADMPQRQLADLAQSDLSRLLELVERSKATLILTVEPSFSHVPSQLHEFVVPLAEHPAAADVLMAHLRHHVGDAEAQQIFARPEVSSRVDDLVGVALTAAEVVVLALELTGRDELLGDAELGWRLAEHRRAEIARWLATVPESHWPFLLSLSVYDGLAYDTVVTAARHFIALCEADPLTKLKPLTAARRADLLEKLRAEIHPGRHRTGYGDVPVDLVRFRRPGTAQWVLEYLWRHAHEFRGPIIGWLTECAGLNDMRAQRKVGAAVGQLMIHDFPAVESQIFTAWRRDATPWKREAALIAITVAGEHSDLRLVFVRKALSWMKEEYWDKWMAARSFGEPLGRLVPEGTLAVLGELAKDKDLQPYAVGQALREFANGQPDDIFESALSAVLSWTEDRASDRRKVGVYSFLQMCAHIKDAGGLLPRILTRPVNGHDDPAIAMWRHAIADENLHKVARQVLFTWALACEPVEVGPDRLARLLTRVAGTSRLTFLIQSAAKAWRADKFPAPRSADAVLAAIADTKAEVH